MAPGAKIYELKIYKGGLEEIKELQTYEINREQLMKQRVTNL